MIRLFDIGGVNASASRFDGEKLKWLNQQYLKSSPAGEPDRRFRRQLLRAGVDPAAGRRPAAVIEAYRERAATLRDLAESAVVSVRGSRRPWTRRLCASTSRRQSARPLGLLVARLEELASWTREEIHGVLAGSGH